MGVQLFKLFTFQSLMGVQLSSYPKVALMAELLDTCAYRFLVLEINV